MSIKPIKPLVSIIIPAYNAARFVKDAVDSAIKQPYENIEVIVVNDGSKDDTPILLNNISKRDKRVKVIHKENGGLSSARNRGILEASGDYICFLDSDDVILPNKIVRQVEYLESHPECDLIYSDHYVGDDKLHPISLDAKNPPSIPFDELLIYRNWFAPLSPLLRNSLVQKTGLFDEQLCASEDWDYWIRCIKKGRFCYLPGAVGIYRTHSNQMHNDYGLMQNHMRKVIIKNYANHPQKLRVAQASLIWCRAKWHWSQKHYFRTGLSLLRFVWLAKTVHHIKTIRELL